MSQQDSNPTSARGVATVRFDDSCSTSKYHPEMSQSSVMFRKELSLPFGAKRTGRGSKSEPPRLIKDDGEEEEKNEAYVYFKVILLAVIWFGVPYYCRDVGLSSANRCILVIVAVLVINLAEAMPLFCTALFIPVLGTMCQVLGDGRSAVATSTLLVGSIFNNISFLVLGALVINGIFVKCRLERKLMALLLNSFTPDSKYFLLFLLLGGMAMCSVLYSGSLVLLSALRPIISPVETKDAVAPPIAKRLMLAVAFAANAGSVWLPISSPVNLITIALLQEFEHDIGLTEWVMVAIPFSTIAMIFLWLVMLQIYPDEKLDEMKSINLDEDQLDMQRKLTMVEVEEQEEAEIALTPSHYFFIVVAVLALVGITVFMPVLQPIFGHAACISIMVVVMAFGSGFMSREEFLNLDWDLLMLVGGTNVMAFMVRETGLGAELSNKVVASEFFTLLPYWGLLCLLVVGTVMISTTAGHTLTGVLLLPLIVALGLKLQAAETTALLVALAIPFGMGLPQSSFDNSSAYTESRKYDRPRVALTQRDFAVPGIAVTVCAVVLLIAMGLPICVLNYGLPPPVVVSEVSKTPEKLQPKIVIENRPKEAEQVSYNKLMTNWKTFLEKPEKKAFAIGKLKDKYKTRPWAASWNHETQEGANKAALDECERIAGECRLIYPEPGHKHHKTLEDRMDDDEEADAHSLRQEKGSDSFLRRKQRPMMGAPKTLQASQFTDEGSALNLHRDAHVPRKPVTCGYASNRTCAMQGAEAGS